MGRRGENIHKRKDGRWEARVIYNYSKNGKTMYRYLYGKTYQEAKNKRNMLLAELQMGKELSVKQPNKIRIRMLLFRIYYF